MNMNSRDRDRLGDTHPESGLQLDLAVGSGAFQQEALVQGHVGGVEEATQGQGEDAKWSLLLLLFDLDTKVLMVIQSWHMICESVWSYIQNQRDSPRCSETKVSNVVLSEALHVVYSIN